MFRSLIRRLLPWLARLAGALIVLLLVAWIAGTVLIYRREPDRSTSLPPEIAGRLITAGGRQVHVVEAGHGEPVILVHGFAGSSRDWEDTVMPALAATRRVVAVDLLGMGFSERSSDLDYGFNVWSRQVLDVMDALGIARTAIVGHSLGGAVTALVAGEHPDRVERIVLVAPLVPLEQSERPWFFKLLETPGVGELMLGTTDHLPQLPGFSDAYHARAHLAFLRRGTRNALLRYLRHGRDLPRLVAAYGAIRAPTLIVAGTADDVVPYAGLRRWAPAINDALVLPLDGTGHWVMRDQPQRLEAAIEDFLAGRD